MKILRRILAAIVIILVVAVAYNRYDHADREHRVTPQALAALESDSDVAISQEGKYIVFSPADSTPTTGLIFYPGGECDERGYAEPLRAIADEGYLVVLVPMPLQLAFLGIDKADDIMAAFPEIRSWAIAGHSLGGSMAARYAFRRPETLDGLLLWDSYAPDDLTESGLAVSMIHRSDESLKTPESYVEFLPLLPADTQFVPIVGGNHLNFGSFIAGRMYRDEPPAELAHDTQIERVARATIDFLDSITD
ncbi:MAG TPA: alpha/beta hydrolase [Gammaproteobacteria bacterium]|nr:alpha/beta hydrolase [Gammaproteobacteria bacterium]